MSKSGSSSFGWWIGGAAIVATTSCGGGDSGTSPTPPPANVATVSVVPDSANVVEGATRQLSATAKDATGKTLTGRQITWISSDPTVATVSGNGLVTAVLPGRAIVTATAEGKSGTSVILSQASVDSLIGQASAFAVAAIRRQSFTFREGDYAIGAADLPGLKLSFNTVSVLIAPDATIGAVNALLHEFNAKIVGGMPGVANSIPGLLALRLPTTTHAEMAERLEALRARTVIRSAVRDKILEPATLPAPVTQPFGWGWSTTQPDYTWGMQAIRAPQMWNLNDAITKSKRKTVTAVFDNGFATQHEDLNYFANLTPGSAADHGTHVAGIIGATFNNGRGVDGANPFAALVVKAFSSSNEWLFSFDELMRTTSGVRVINVSLGYNWGKSGIDANTNASAQLEADADGDFVRNTLQLMSAFGSLPVIVVAAGNDSDFGFGIEAARYASPWANAGIRGSAPIIVVEADSIVSATGALTRSTFSNIGGVLSAPGSKILSTMPPNVYIEADGTSQAAPHVAGLIGFLYALDPTLAAPTMSSNPMKDHLLKTLRSVGGGAAGMIDAFAAAMDIDRLKNSDNVLRALVDIDDGTRDGNMRIDKAGLETSSLDEDGDGGIGDGHIDMSDFRRWRDWLLDVEQPSNLDLNGLPINVKRDANGDQTVGSSDHPEQSFSRGDFNGDAVISSVFSSVVPGAMKSRKVTDLEMLQEVFDDPNYQKSQLPDLIQSVDFTIDLVECRKFPDVSSMRILVTAIDDSTDIIQERTVGLADDSVQVLTVAFYPPGYRVRVDATLTSGGDAVPSTPNDTTVGVGADIFYDADCVGRTIDGDVLVTSTAELDDLANVGKITGNLEVRSVPSVDLHQLGILGEVGGAMRLRQLAQFTGFPAGMRLRRLGSFVVDSAQALRSLTGLDSLKTNLVLLDLRFTPALQGLGALNSKVVTSLRLEATGLDSLRVTNLQVVSVVIEKEPRLASLKGLIPPANGVLSRLDVHETPNLKDLGQIAGMTRIGRLSIVKSGSDFFTGFQNLITITGLFEISQVSGSAPLAAFAKLDSLAFAGLIDPGTQATVTFPALRSVVGQLRVRQDTDCPGVQQNVTFPVLRRAGNSQQNGAWIIVQATRCPMSVSFPVLQETPNIVLLDANLVSATLPTSLNTAIELARTGLTSFRVPALSTGIFGVDILDNPSLQTLTFAGAIDVPRLWIDNNPELQTVSDVSGVVRVKFIVTNNPKLKQSDIDAWSINKSGATITVFGNKP